MPRAAGLLLVAAAVACGRPAERRGGPLVPWTGPRNVVSGVAAPGAAIALGLPTFAVRAEVVVDRVELVGADPALRVLDTRMSFVACPSCHRRAGYVGVTGSATEFCVGHYPPSDFGPTYEAAGLHLFERDAPSLLLYLTADGPGRHEAQGFRVHYRTARGRRYVIEVRSTALAVEQHDPTADRNACSRPTGSIWTGGTGGIQRVVPLG
jgi:hypothetical protein